MTQQEQAIVAEAGTEYAPHSQKGQWVEVLVDCPGTQGIYTYRLPEGWTVQPGDILTVPFGAQQLGAIALRSCQSPPADLDPSQVRSVIEVISRGFFPPHYWTLLERIADYYCTPLMQVIRTALPPGLLARSQRRIRLTGKSDVPFAPLSPAADRLLQLLQSSKSGDYTWQYLQRQVPGANRGLRELLRTGQVESYLEAADPVRPKLRQAVILTSHSLPDLTQRQREVLEVLKRQGGDLWLSDLLQLCRTTSTTLKTLESKGCLVIQPREILRAEAEIGVQADRPQSLTPAQTLALAQITALPGYTRVLLHGVTGSGKTEVYLQAIAPLLQQGKSALVLVPEIGLTPQLTDRFRARFGGKVRVYHSALSEGERYDTWRQMLVPAPQVVIGTRSAIFAPLPHLGLIVLDEEHDSSFKQDQPAPCYHARTVAQWRAEAENCPLILGSATPSLESWVEMGVRSQESGVRSQESGVRSQESGVGSRESGVRSQESGVRSQESGVRRQESGVGSQESGVGEGGEVREDGEEPSDSSLIPHPSSLSDSSLSDSSLSDSSLIPHPSSLSDSSLIPPPSSLSDSSFRPHPSSLSDSSLIPHPSSLYLSLPDRVHARPFPTVEVVDMRQELHQGNSSIFSRTLQQALQEMGDRRQQGILFIHRRGHSTFVSCRSCGYVLGCPDCDVSLAYHHTHAEATQLLRCHYCNYTRLHPPQCPECGSPYLKFFGSGTQRVAQELERKFPELRVIRFDSDTTRTKGSHRALLTRFANGEADLLVGTQMLTKGIDLPLVTLVGVVAADGLLHLPDFRASERAFQTLTQVVGRSGRGEEPGRAIVQTYAPENPVIQAVQCHDYQAFVTAELAHRASLSYPPAGRLVLLRLSSLDLAAVQKAADQVAAALRTEFSSLAQWELLGPAPASIPRVAQRYRWQILLKFSRDMHLKFPDLEVLRSQCPASVSLTIDVDPLNLL